jgi:rubrerythrin
LAKDEDNFFKPIAIFLRSTEMEMSGKILEALQQAYQIEVDGYTFYSMTAERAQKPAVKELFEKLAQDEIQHQAFLRSVSKGYEEKGTAAFAVQRKPVDFLSAFGQKVFTDRFREQAKGAAFELGVLSVGMTLETNAVNCFVSAAKEARGPEIRNFYEFLAEWERQHFDALKALYDGVRMDFWHEGGFAAF